MPLGTQFYIKEGMLSEELINADVNDDGELDHYYFSIKNQKLHAKQPLGNIQKLFVRIDGDEIETNRIYFVLRDQWFGIEKLQTIKDVWWNLREEAQIFIEQKGGIDAGKHIVEITLENQSFPFYSKGIRPAPTLNLQIEMSTP